MIVSIRISSLSLMPGWVLGCSVLETLLRSTLEVLYNQTLIDNLEIYLTTSDPITYPTRVYAKAMNTSLISQFQTNISFQVLVHALFVEQWHINVSFPSFYQQCIPLYCVYTINQHKNLLYVGFTL